MDDVIVPTLKTDLAEFRRAQAKKARELLSRVGKVSRDGAGVYMRWMAQMAPPSIGSVQLHSAKPNSDIYERPAMLIPVALAHGSKTAALDAQKLRAGYSWKVIVRGKPVYYKGRGNVMPNKVKGARHIRNRGLARWGFLGTLPNAGIAIPVVMRPLAARQRGTDLKKNENRVGSSVMVQKKGQIKFIMRQHIEFVSGSWVANARRRAEAKYREYLATMLRKTGRIAAK